MKRLLSLPLILLPAALLLSGCFTLETEYVVNEDGSGSQSIRFALPPEMVSTMGGEAPSVEEAESSPELQEIRDALGDTGSITFFSSPEEGFGFEITMNVEPSDDVGAALVAKAEELTRATADTEMPLGELTGAAPTIRRDGDSWVFEAAMEELDAATIAALSGDPSATEMASFFGDQITLTTRLTLPGEVTEHNADEVLEDGTLVWTMTASSPARTLTARSEVGGGGLPTAAMAGLLIGGIALVAGIAGYGLFGRRRAAV